MSICHEAEIGAEYVQELAEPSKLDTPPVGLRLNDGRKARRADLTAPSAVLRLSFFVSTQVLSPLTATQPLRPTV